MNPTVEIGRVTVDATEAWRHVWRNGIAPLLSLDGLTALQRAIENDDKALIQGATTEPPALLHCHEWPCEAACAVGYAVWKGESLQSVGDVERHFADLICRADNRLGEPAGVRYFLNTFDDCPREWLAGEFLPEIKRSIAERSVVIEW